MRREVEKILSRKRSFFSIELAAVFVGVALPLAATLGFRLHSPGYLVAPSILIAIIPFYLIGIWNVTNRKKAAIAGAIGLFAIPFITVVGSRHAIEAGAIFGILALWAYIAPLVPLWHSSLYIAAGLSLPFLFPWTLRPYGCFYGDSFLVLTLLLGTWGSVSAGLWSGAERGKKTIGIPEKRKKGFAILKALYSVSLIGLSLVTSSLTLHIIKGWEEAYGCWLLLTYTAPVTFSLWFYKRTSLHRFVTIIVILIFTLPPLIWLLIR